MEATTLIANPPVQLSREQIMEVTARCLHQVGYDGTTIRKIASELGCAIGSIYRYFTDKRELLDAVTQQRLEPVAALAEAGSLEASLRMYLQRATETGQMYRLMFWLSAVENQPVDANPAPAVVQRIIAGWAKSIGDASVARQVWSLLHGGIMLGTATPTIIDALLRTIAERNVARQVASAVAAKAEQTTAAVEPAEQHVEDVCLL